MRVQLTKEEKAKEVAGKLLGHLQCYACKKWFHPDVITMVADRTVNSSSNMFNKCCGECLKSEGFAHWPR